MPVVNKRNHLSKALISGYHNGTKGPGSMLSGEFGGQWSTNGNVIGRLDINGLAKAEWISSQAHIQGDVQGLLLQYPIFMDMMPEEKRYKRQLKSFIETHLETVEGLNSAITIETERNMLGAAGNVFIDEVVGARAEASSVTVTATDKYGMVFSKLFEDYISYGIMDHNTQKVIVSNFSKEARAYIKRSAWLHDMFSMTILWYATDVTNLIVQRAWLHFGAFPTTDSGLAGSANRGSAKAIHKITIPLAGPAITNKHIDKYAQEKLDAMAVRFGNPNHQLPVNATDADINDVNAPVGYNAAGAGLKPSK